MTPRARQASRARGIRPGRGVLAVVIGLLVASGVLRLGDEAGRAYATVTDPAAPAAPVPAQCDAPPETAALLEAFRLREQRLALRETQVADRMQALQVAENEIAEKLAALEAAESSLAATLALAETAAVSDIDRLTAVYQSMKPADAAALFEEMPPEFSAGFIARMQPEAAAAVMGGLQSATAYSISVVLAGRNARVPTE